MAFMGNPIAGGGSRPNRERLIIVFQIEPFCPPGIGKASGFSG
jgi:hypothetical protein